MGDSAGGGLCVLTGIQLLRQSRPQPAGYVLLSPWLDHSGQPFEGGCPMVETDYVIYANTMVPYFSKLWCGSYAGTSPEVNPLYRAPDELRGMSPQLVLVGAAEFALNEAVAWGYQCGRAGVRCKVVREWGMMHIYALGSSWLPQAVRNKTDKYIIDWIEMCLGDTSLEAINSL